MVASNASNEITGLKNGAATVNADNYTIDELELTVKATYLKGLAVGEKDLTILLSKGADLAVLVEVTA